MMHSAQKRCRHSLVVMVLLSQSRQMGQVNCDWSDCKAGYSSDYKNQAGLSPLRTRRCWWTLTG